MQTMAARTGNARCGAKVLRTYLVCGGAPMMSMVGTGTAGGPFGINVKARATTINRTTMTYTAPMLESSFLRTSGRGRFNGIS